MGGIYLAACKLDNKVIRIVYIADDNGIEAAKDRFFALQPGLRERIGDDLSVDFVEMLATTPASRRDLR